MMRVYLFKFGKILPISFNFPDFDRCSIVTECKGFAIFSLRFLILWKYLYLVESSWIHCFCMKLLKFLFINISTTNWYRVDFNFTTLPLLTWIGVIIWAANNLLSFIFTTGLCVEYNFLSFHFEYSFIVLLNVSWRSKWFSKILWFLECWSDTRAWMGLHVILH